MNSGWLRIIKPKRSPLGHETGGNVIAVHPEVGVRAHFIGAHAAAVEGDHVEVGRLFRARRNQICQNQFVSFSHDFSSRSRTPSPRADGLYHRAFAHSIAAGVMSSRRGRGSFSIG
jgi:hypothetical protein